MAKRTKANSTRDLTVGRWWLIIGAAAFIGVGGYGAFASWDGAAFAASVDSAFDWLAAGVVYAFFGALVGHLIDWGVATRRGQRTTHPAWAWCAIGLWALGIALSFLFVDGATANALMLLFFPFTFGIFLHGTAYSIFAPTLVRDVVWGKAILNVLYLGAFGAWTWMTIQDRKRTATARHVLLFLIFLVLAIGTSGCVRSLTSG